MDQISCISCPTCSLIYQRKQRSFCGESTFFHPAVSVPNKLLFFFGTQRLNVGFFVTFPCAGGLIGYTYYLLSINTFSMDTNNFPVLWTKHHFPGFQCANSNSSFGIPEPNENFPNISMEYTPDPQPTVYEGILFNLRVWGAPGVCCEARFIASLEQNREPVAHLSDSA